MPHGLKQNQKGFTIHEMLLVVAISIVLLAVSVVGILTYMRYLRLTELDNSAKEIFLAAQNRAVLLRSSQQLERCVDKGDNTIAHVNVIPDSDNTTQITVYYIHCNDGNISQLLPRESIDPTLWDGDFWITYEPESGSVIDVFFCDKDLAVHTDGDFAAFYEKWRAAAKSARMSRNPMVGYYGGESAESGSTISLRTPVINISNKDTLQVDVTYWVPRALLGDLSNVKLDVTLTYQTETIPLEKDSVPSHIGNEIAYLSYTYTWILDSLDQEEMQFYELFPSASNLSYGNDFTVAAEVYYDKENPSLNVNGALKKATDNSLFAKGSGDQTAYIDCLRHLQNLDQEWSSVSKEKTIAIQQRDIQGVDGYTFHPIENVALNSYDGGEFSIYDLDIKETDNTAAGLFGTFSGTSAQNKTLSNIRLVNTAVTAAGNGSVGALVGDGSYLKLNNCQIYWENHSEETTNLREVLGDSATHFNYQITGSGPAGGLAGTLRSTTIEDCSASTLVYSPYAVGGLVGEGSGLTMKKSYAASYLAGPAAAGLVGNLTGNETTISGSYAVGFINSGTTSAAAAGLCLGAGTAQVTNSYSAMLFTVENTATNYPLCQTEDTDTKTYYKTYYLDSELFHFKNPIQASATSYSTLINPNQWDDLFDQGVFDSKSTAQSHPYNLQTTLSLTTYIYPGLKKLDHWGDWGAQFQNGSLVYYEIYKDNDDTTYGFSGGSLKHLSDDKTVIQDGYAVAYKGTKATSGIDVTLSVTYQDGISSSKTVEQIYQQNDMFQVSGVADSTGVPSEYYLLPLPDEVVMSSYADPNFYQKITIYDIAEHTKTSYYYSPHFANTVIPYDEELSTADLADLLKIEVRTPRHLNMLSKFEPYYASNHQYRFLQQLDLDYSTYTGYQLFTGAWSQAPIGLDAASPFRCSYYGNYHTITGVVPAVKDEEGNLYQHVGLFGYTTTGVLQDVVYQMQKDTTLSVTQSGSRSKTLYVGALVGYNGGTVDNCACFDVQLQANGYQYSTIYLGGLVGQNRGSVQNSAVEGASISADASMSHAYAGGFVGENSAGGIIDQCYAVGKVSVTQARYGTVSACGFAGHNTSTLSRSYAAVYLLADGDANRYGFCPDNSTNCVYLNNGNFTYRGENYAALYEDLYAQDVTWEALAGQLEAESDELAAVDALGMGRGAVSNWKEETYPYPATVTVKDGSYIHYGQWPERMDLGAMGVYYWEKLTIGQNESYHISAISLTAHNRVMKSGTLSTAHGDGGVVTEYGYGYFSQEEVWGQVMPTTLTSKDIYWDNNPFNSTISSDSEADQAFFNLMGGKYTFHSYSTWQASENKGLHVIQSGQADGSQPPYGLWTLEQGAYSLTVQLNPFFADSMSYPGTLENINAPTDLPGTSNNPYEVRSIQQLQFINWNSAAKNTNLPTKEDNYRNFPYLSYGWNNLPYARNFYWEQTHDLDGSHVKNYTPIAALQDLPNNQEETKGYAYAWFSGSYNGNDYTIQQLSIVSTGSYNTTGLFGFTRDAILSNIILYSPDGSAVIVAQNTSNTWYAMGGLVGLAANTSQSNRTIENCAVAGYTIIDANKGCAYGGGGVGGLVGICNMALKNCTAVTDIQLAFRHNFNNRNVRVGGIAGSCQQSITTCYSGGSISLVNTFSDEVIEKVLEYGVQLTDGLLSTSASKLHVGGIVGGYYMKVLNMLDGKTLDPKIVTIDGVDYAPADKIPHIRSCYTYIAVSNEVKDKCEDNGSYFAIGGLGELKDSKQKLKLAIYGNCYYLSGAQDTSALDKDASGVANCTYKSLAEGDAASSLKAAGFSTVTTTASGGAPLNGRYSFGSDLSLLGKDYPFPTILTQSSDLVASGNANVHYGDWPLAGIRRENGALPVNLDLFADYKTENHGAVHKEQLSLEGVPGDGIWGVTSQDDTIATPSFLETSGDKRTLVITAFKAGSTVVTVTYNVGNEKYSLDIDVNVTAELRLAAEHSPVTVFTSETVQTSLKLLDRNNKPLANELNVSLDNFQVEFDPTYFTQASIKQGTDLTLEADSVTTNGSTQMTLRYNFTYLTHVYPATSSLALRLVTPEITLTPVVISFEADANQTDEKTVTYTGLEEDQFILKLNNREEAVTGLRIVDFEFDPIYNQTALVQWDKKEDGSDKEGTLSIEAYYPTFGATSVLVRVQFQFEYEDSIHKVWKDLEIQIKKEATTDGTEEVQP